MEDRPKHGPASDAGNGAAGREGAGPNGAVPADGPEHEPAVETKPLRYYLGFHLGEEIFALPLQQLREVVPLTAITRVPGAPPKVAGLVNLRGQIICAFHARACLQLPSTAPSQEPIVLVLQGFEEPLGLIVDSIVDVYGVDPERIQPPGDGAPDAGDERVDAAAAAAGAVRPELVPYLSGTVAVDGAVLGLLDLDRVIQS